MMRWSEETLTEEQLRKERKDILRAYRGLLKPGRNPVREEDKELIRKAFDIALEAHQDMRRKSGEPYIFHPIAVAKIAKEDIGMQTTGIVCALLHDVVEDTELTLDDIEQLFGKKIASIIDGLTKISELFDQNTNLQAENFKKLILTLAQDVRVILIKLADRLHNMRTLDHMREDKRLKIASETLYLYAPLAHKLGLYNIKSEMEDLSLKYMEPEVYQDLKYQLQKSKAVRTRFLNRFSLPIERALNEAGLKYRIAGRTKSIYSIYSKMRKQKIPFSEVYDILAVRIVLESDDEMEKADIWKTYSIVTDFYKPNPDRLRDWISTPKANGYESLHITVMSPTGKWVEVQIRSERMNEVAENGYAAHWKYKESAADKAVDEWIQQIRETIETEGFDTEEFLSDFRLNLFEEEIITFSPKGDAISLPVQSTPVDFAYTIHSQIGDRCIGAKVNSRLVPLSHHLHTGDQVEVITSSKGRPQEEWLRFVKTAKAKSKIKSHLKSEKKRQARVGRTILRNELKDLGIKNNNDNLYKIAYFYNLPSLDELFFEAKNQKLDLEKLKSLRIEKGLIRDNFRKSKNAIITNIGGKASFDSSEGQQQGVAYRLAECCNPIPGEKVFGFISGTRMIEIHRVNCPKALDMQSHKHHRVIEAKWTSQQSLAFLVGIKITGIDQVGMVNDITNIISQDMNVNMRSVHFESLDGFFEGEVRAYVTDIHNLNDLMHQLNKVDGVDKVTRIDASK
jgi:guanosine-3',5'-bis(diphosphate) 3'-pyrophosphohydrolase